jgi:hypothetical protein
MQIHNRELLSPCTHILFWRLLFTLNSAVSWFNILLHSRLYWIMATVAKLLHLTSLLQLPMALYDSLSPYNSPIHAYVSLYLLCTWLSQNRTFSHLLANWNVRVVTQMLHHISELDLWLVGSGPSTWVLVAFAFLRQSLSGRASSWHHVPLVGSAMCRWPTVECIRPILGLDSLLNLLLSLTVTILTLTLHSAWLSLWPNSGVYIAILLTAVVAQCLDSDTAFHHASSKVELYFSVTCLLH